MKKLRSRKMILIIALMVVVTLIAGVALVSAGGKPGPTGTYKVIAYNDLGMHCA